MRGMVRQRGRTWTAYWWLTDPASGESRQHSKGGFENKTAARDHLTATIAKVHAGEWAPDRKLSVKELWEEIGCRPEGPRAFGNRLLCSTATLSIGGLFPISEGWRSDA